MDDSKLKKIKIFHKVIFYSTGLFLITSAGYKYVCEKHPSFLKDNLFDRFFEQKHKEIEKKEIVIFN